MLVLQCATRLSVTFNGVSFSSWNQHLPILKIRVLSLNELILSFGLKAVADQSNFIYAPTATVILMLFAFSLAWSWSGAERLPRSKMVTHSIPSLGMAALSVWSLHVGCSGFLSQSEGMSASQFRVCFLWSVHLKARYAITPVRRSVPI